MTPLPRMLIRLLAVLVFCGGAMAAQAQSKPAEIALSVTGTVEKPLSISFADLQLLPHKSAKTFNSHEKKEETYEGVPLTDLLARAGVPQGPKLRGAAMATYIQAGGADGYRVVLALAETDSDFQDSDIIVADKMNGQPMNANLGPLRLILPHDKRPARWVRMLQTIQVVTVPK